MRSRKLLALLFCLITFPALAGYMTLLGAGVGSIAPVVSWVSTTDPTFPSSSLTFSRTSLATMFDSTGKLTYAPNNLALNTATLGTQTVTVQVGVNYLISFASGGGSIALSGAGAGTVTSASPVKITASTTTLTLTVTGTVTNAVVAAVTYETSPRTADQVITTSSAYYGPRIDYDPNTLAVKGLLIEEARTNLAINSASLSSFSPFSMTATTNFAVAPDGTSAATKLDDGTTAAVPHQVAYSPSGLSASTAYAFSVFAKQGTGRYLTLSNVGSSSADGGYAVFDLQAGTVTQSAALGAGSLTSATITPINGGWYRLSVVTVAGTNTARFLFVLGSNSGTYTADSNGRNSYTGTNNTWLVWGAQLELGSFATSYIPTAASSVTRAADVVQFTGAALTALQGSAATFIGQTIGLPFNPAANSALVAATAGNSVIAYVTNSNAVGVAAAATYNGAAALTVGTPNYATTMRIGSAFSGSGRSLVVNGGSVATDANAIGSRPAVYLGGTGASLYLNGWMQSFAIYNQRLPDATLQTKSVVGASYAANDNGVRFANNDNLPIHWRVAL